MFRRLREEGRRKRWLAVLHEVREEDADDGAIIAHLLARGLLEPDEAGALRRAARRDTVTRSAMDAFERSRLRDYLLLAIAGAGAVALTDVLVGRSENVFAVLASAVGAQVALFAAASAFDRFLLYRLIGPPVALPPRLPGEQPRMILAGAERFLDGRRLVQTGELVGPPVLLAIVGAAQLRGLLVVALVASALTVLIWLLLFRVLRLVANERLWRYMVARDRAIPLALAVALDLTWCLARAEPARPTPHGAPLWLAVYFRTRWVYNRHQLLEIQWATGASHRRPRRGQIAQAEAAIAALNARYADRFEQAATPEQLREALLEIRDHLRSALAGDLSFLGDDVASSWWQRTLPRALTALVLAAAAIALPHLPGITASGSALAGIQVGLAVTAVLTVVGAPADAQKSVADAVKSASATK